MAPRKPEARKRWAVALRRAVICAGAGFIGAGIAIVALTPADSGATDIWLAVIVPVLLAPPTFVILLLQWVLLGFASSGRLRASWRDLGDVIVVAVVPAVILLAYLSTFPSDQGSSMIIATAWAAPSALVYGYLFRAGRLRSCGTDGALRRSI